MALMTITMIMTIMTIRRIMIVIISPNNPLIAPQKGMMPLMLRHAEKHALMAHAEKHC